MEQDRSEIYAQLVARVWRDEAFKQRLISDPHAVLAEHGVEVPPGVGLKVVEDPAQVRHILLPAVPEGLSPEQHDSAAADAIEGYGLFS